MSEAALDAGGAKAPGGIGRWIVYVMLVAASAVLAAFYGVNQYFSLTGAEIDKARSASERFETVYRDTANSKMETLVLALETLISDRKLVRHFVKRDRDALLAHTTPYFQQVLLKGHKINQLNFFTPPGVEYLRVQDPRAFGADVTKTRQTIVAAIERRQIVSAPETGLGGVIGLRAVAPIVDDKLEIAGTVGLNDPLVNSLERARATLDMDWALGLNKDRAEAVERPADPKLDSFQGNDVFWQYSSPEVSRLVRAARFDPRAPELPLIEAGERTLFIRCFPINNFAGKPTIVVATVRDLTEPMRAIGAQVVAHSLAIFAAAAALSCFAFLRFRSVREGLMSSLARQRMELDEKSAFCETAVTKLREVEMVKRGFFANLVGSVVVPLQAVTGQLYAVLAALKAPAASGVPADFGVRMQLVIREIARIIQLVRDYHQIEVFRQRLTKDDIPLAPVGALVAQMVVDDLASARRLAQLSIDNAVPANLVATRAEPELLRRALRALVEYAVERGARGTIVLDGEVDAEGWVRLRIAGSAYRAAGAPDAALLDASRRVLAQPGAADDGARVEPTLVALALARLIVESCGGSLEALAHDAAQPGFVVRLPRAL